MRATSDLNAISKPIITVDTRCLPTSLFFKDSASLLGKSPAWLFLAVQDSSIGDLVTQSVSQSGHF